MLLTLRSLPRLQRKLAYVVAGSALIYLIYSLSNFGGQLQSHFLENKDRAAVTAATQPPVSQKASSVPKSESDLKNSVHADADAGDGNDDDDDDDGRLKLHAADDPAFNKVDSLHDDLEEVDLETPAMVQVPTSRHHILSGLQGFKGPETTQQKAIVEAFLHAWGAYKKYAWGLDELRPLSRSGQQWMGVGLTIVDSLDTIILMGLTEEYTLARDWIAANLNFDYDGESQLFEMTIRVLGGLLSAYHLSGDELFLNKAIELGVKLNPCFNGATRIPCNRINLKRQQPTFVDISTAECGSIQLEFRDLSRSSNDSRFEVKANAVSLHIHGLQKLDGLVSCFLSPSTGLFQPTSSISIGASADSYYEYLLKQWIQTGKIHEWLRSDYLKAIEGVKKHLLRYSEPNKLAYVGAIPSRASVGQLRNEMEHLSCFLPGTLALGVIHGLDRSHLQLAADLVKTCYKMYESMPTKLSPEIAIMNTDPSVDADISTQYNTRYNLQRPETVESIFYMYRATNNPMYRDWGWKIFEAFEKYTRVEAGYASIDNVMWPENPGYKDKMESFFLAETLKYFYLLFSDDPTLLDLEKFVMNTEAHPLPVYTS